MENYYTTPKSSLGKETANIKSRNPYIAGVFAFLAFSLGHLYVGRFQRGMILLAVFIGLITLIVVSRLLQSYPGVLVSSALVIVYSTFMIFDAVRLAKKQKQYALKYYNRWYVYLGFYILISVLQSYIIGFRGPLLGYESYRIPSASMEPTIQVGDFIMVDTWAYNEKTVERGDIVVFKYPKDPSTNYIFRVIALPGETFEYYNKKIQINGQVVPQFEQGNYSSLAMPHEEFLQKVEKLENLEYKILISRFRPTINKTMIVPENHYLVMGDNRDNANDSRYWGYVPAEFVRGRANFIWFSWSSQGGGTRSDRFGEKL